MLAAGPGGGPAAAAALGLPDDAPADHSADYLEPSTASALELALEHTEIASGLVVEPAHAPASKAVHKVVHLEQMPPLVDQARSPIAATQGPNRPATVGLPLELPGAYLEPT